MPKVAIELTPWIPIPDGSGTGDNRVYAKPDIQRVRTVKEPFVVQMYDGRFFHADIDASQEHASWGTSDDGTRPQHWISLDFLSGACYIGKDNVVVSVQAVKAKETDPNLR
jgi:hypothetical protein